MRLLCYALLVVLLAASCRDKVICPTFQSTYILDDSVRSTYFSYLWYLSEDERKAYLAANAKPSEVLPPDSLGAMVASTDKSAGVDYFAYTAEYKPDVRDTKKTKYGIIKRTPVIPDMVRNIQLKTGPRQNILTPPVPDQEEKPADIPQDSSSYAPLDSTAAVAQTDSLGISRTDSTAVAEKVEKKQAPWVPFKYGFNPLDSMQPDQEYYFRKYGWLLQNPKPKEEASDSTASDSTAMQKKGIKGLFRKKNAEEEDGTDVSEGEGADDWYQEEGQGAQTEESETEEKQPEQKQPKEKKPKEKKPKDKKPKETKPEETSEPEEEGDGF